MFHTKIQCVIWPLVGCCCTAQLFSELLPQLLTMLKMLDRDKE